MSYTGADRVWAEWIAWQLEEAGYQVKIQVPGTTKLHRLEENIGAASFELTPEDLQRIEAAVTQVQIQGARYPTQMQKTINR